MSTITAQPAIGFIGLGDQGLPMATAIAEAGYPLHVWARRPSSLAALGTIAHGRADEGMHLLVRRRPHTQLLALL
jgi:3-hydroxyisobutyrate dehydrogenase-like beta-hydroxyacid dehydrogenase